MLSCLQASPEGIAHYVPLLIRVAAFLLVLLQVGVFLSRATKKAWYLRAEAANGVDAAEKGDTKRLLLEKVPYDLQKRAILHKVSQSMTLGRKHFGTL